MGFFEIFAAALAGLYAVIPSIGLGIILLTLVVRALLLPLSIKQTKSMREMALIGPEVKRIQQKYKNDRQKMNEATMALYKEHGVNPFGGCLPLLLQFPVFIGLFYVIRYPFRYLEGDFLGDTALANALRESAERVYSFLGILHLDRTVSQVWSDSALQAIPYVLLIGLMGLTTWYQQRQMTASRGANDPQAQQMQMIGRIMPVVLVVFGFQFPAGVVLYWVTTNVWTIAQQRLILGRFGPPPGAGGAPAKPKPKGEVKTGGNTSKGSKASGGAGGKTKASGGQTGNGQKTGGGGRQAAASKKRRRK